MQTNKRPFIHVVTIMLTMLVPGCQLAPPQSGAPGASTAGPRVSGTPPVVAPQVFITGVALPVGLTFAPDGRLFFVEVNKGTVRIVENGLLKPEPFATLDVAKGSEQGVLGLTLDPQFNDNHFVYVYFTVPKKKGGKADFNRVVRFAEHDDQGSDPQIIFDRIPADVKGSHNGGRMRFGPDGKLYVTTGAPGDEDNDAQRMDVLEGKILRLNPDGSVPSDNPVPGSPVYALGMRNPYGIDFDPQNKRLYAVDNGPKCCDELDLVRPGGNYGAPVVAGSPGDPRFIDPIWNSAEERLGVSGLAFYTGSKLPEYSGDAFYCLWNTGLLRRVRLAAPEYERVEQMEDIAVDCRLDVANGPDGALYISNVTQILRLDR